MPMKPQYKAVQLKPLKTVQYREECCGRPMKPIYNAGRVIGYLCRECGRRILA